MDATTALAQAESSLKSEEDKVGAVMRAIADAREGTARQEGHIKSLRARLEAIAEEIARLEKSRNDAQQRADEASRAYSNFELEIASADSSELGLDSHFENTKSKLEAAKKTLSDLVDDERNTEREKNALEAKLEALRLTSKSNDGASALLSNSRGVKILGSVSSLISIEKGYESAVAAALGSLADAIVVQDLSSAVSALTTMRSENLGQADVLVFDGNSRSSDSMPSGLTPLTNYVQSSSIASLLNSLLSATAVVDSARDAADVLRNHPAIQVVTRDGDIISSIRARGGSKSTSSLIEIHALIAELTSKLEDVTHRADRIRFEISTATNELATCQNEYDQALAKLNESDARIAALTEQLAVAGQNAKSASAEVDRLEVSIAEASAAKSRDENELNIASDQLLSQGETPEPDYAQVEVFRAQVSIARSTEVD